MPRTLDDTLIENLRTAEGLGGSLGRLCVKAELPILYVAEMLDVSRMTMHTWLRGGAIQPSRVPKIERFMQLVENDLQSGVLPKKTLVETKEYAEAFCGRPILSTNKKSDITALKVVG